MRFRSWGLRTVVTAIVVLATVPSTGAAASPIDWLFASMTVSKGAPSSGSTGGGSFSIGGGSIGGGSGGGGSLTITVSGHSTGTGPVLIGSGTGSGGGSPVLSVHDVANGGVRLRTTTDLGGLDVEITPAADGSFGFGSGVFGPGPSFSELFFVTNAVIDRYSVRGSGGTPVVSVGSGSRAIQMAGPEASGIAVDTSAAAIGAATFNAVTSKGIAGGLVLGGCIRCTVDWSGPAGRSGSVTQTSPPSVPLPVPDPVPAREAIEGDTSFVGPAGVWSWSWTGLSVRPQPSPTLVGAYAPIGDLWRIFAGLTGGSIGVIAQPKPHQKPEVRGTKQTRRTLPATGVTTPSAVAWLLVAAAGLLGRRLAKIA